MKMANSRTTYRGTRFPTTSGISELDSGMSVEDDEKEYENDMAEAEEKSSAVLKTF
jgi:hypothetical protein